MMKNKFLAFICSIFVCLSFVSCEDNSNPFVGVWKEGASQWDFKSSGAFVRTANYYISDAKKWTDTGTYFYNEEEGTLTLSYDRTGNTYVRTVKYVSYSSIVYYDPSDMTVWNLTRVE